MDGKKVLGILLAVVGGIVVLNFIGVHIGSIIGFLFPFILIGLGVVGYRNDKKWLGGILVALGAIWLFGKYLGLILVIAAIVLIIYGVSQYRNKRSY
ncbi:LiaF transmembrane domain-containing protein [Paenibacillus radicis (ex Gao et al. 2016)]|uniref:LiaF transmembrane domain-containing protein n=1 Tax=Paenibacillus radicis (ex Gao et al. 2016) TaxID=1737354 RepID=A0A917HEB8_9BACL|nr:hypothetical protein [Paenibacillus radicis (ex Gao et al. 2016)]GGG76115.1 hypothetical protein GCM10010918_35690 [Paenibacillus radicis (ex Gao et al. 2016)]